MFKRLLLLVLLVLAASVPGVQAGSGVAKAFQKLQSLAGDWEGRDDKGNVVTSKFNLVVSDTAVLETLRMSGMDEMLTVYSVDNDAIAMLHYCPTNNQPQMRAIPPNGEIKELVFQFQRAGNLPNIGTGHEHKLVIQFGDESHMTERWTWRQNGQETEMVYHFVRVSKKGD